MAVVGGICFLVIGGLNNYIPWEMPLWKQASVGALFVTAMELVVGIPLNLMLGLHIWDYSSLPFNLLGQICLPFTVLWFFLALLCIFVDDWLRYVLFHEERPHYHWRTVCDGGKRA
jgi:predicted membrane protein